jgi:hypothetical protein
MLVLRYDEAGGTDLQVEGETRSFESLGGSGKPGVQAAGALSDSEAGG